MSLDSQGNLYIFDSGPAVIRKLAPSGIITTVPGSALFGNGGQMRGQPYRMAIAPGGDIFLADPLLDLVWRLSTAAS